MRILVTGGSTFFAARLIQGLAARGVEVTVADGKRWSVGKAAGAARCLRTPLLSRDPAGFLATLTGELEARRYDLLLPTFEESLLLAEFRHGIEPLTRLLLPGFEVMWQLHHKPSLYQLCRELQIPAPPTIVPRNADGLERQVSPLQFPVVIKQPAANNCVGRMFCSTPAELAERYGALSRHALRSGREPPFVQQRIEGEPIYTLMLCQAGRKLGEVIYKPLRTYPENGGTSAHRESIAHPAIAALTKRLAEATGWSGFLGLDFIVGRADGTPYLIDANPRATPAIQLGYVAGVDWSEMLMDLAGGRRPVSVVARPGVRTRTILLDIGWLLEGLRPGRGWLRRAAGRIGRFARPGWRLDSSHDLAGSSAWASHIALTWQGLAALGKSLVTGQSLGETMLDGLSYDEASVRRLRQGRTHPLLNTAATLQRAG